MNNGDASDPFCSVRGADSSTLSESSRVSKLGSEVPESITTTIRNEHTLQEDTTIDEFCSECFKKFERVAASHFCRNCPPRGKYLCNNCLKGHNQWTGHKKIYSLSDIQSELTESHRKFGLNKPSVGSTKANEINSWLIGQPEIVSMSNMSVYSKTTFEDSENPYHLIDQCHRENTVDMIKTQPNAISGSKEETSELDNVNLGMPKETHSSLNSLYYDTLDVVNTVRRSETPIKTTSGHDGKEPEAVYERKGKHREKRISNNYDRLDEENTVHRSEMATNTICGHDGKEPEFVYERKGKHREKRLSHNYDRLNEFRPDHYYPELKNWLSNDGAYENCEIKQTPHQNWIVKPKEKGSKQNVEPMFANIRVNEAVHGHDSYNTFNSLNLDIFNPDEESYEAFCLRKNNLFKDDVSDEEQWDINRPQSMYGDTRMKESDYFSPIYTQGRSDYRPTRRKKVSDRCTIV